MIFVDSSFFFALASEEDPDHERVREVFQEFDPKRLRDLWLTTNHIVSETITLTRSSGGHREAVSMGRRLYKEILARIHWATPEEEKKAFADAWEYLQNNRPCSIYYYSKYERTIYRKLQQKYPDICTGDDIEDLFDPVHAVDLYYDVVKKATDWPTIDFSIKTLAKFLGFAWRDTHPSGAASIEWFDRWVKTGDPSIRQRILEYNEDDCIATRVLLDGIKSL